jgi:hypothetical protein
MAECKKCIHEVVCESAKACDGRVPGCEHFKECWISVKDRLPEYDQVVLCYKDDRGVRIGKHMPATYADGVVAFKDLVMDYAFGATHWMPLPQPPKGE